MASSLLRLHLPYSPCRLLLASSSSSSLLFSPLFSPLSSSPCHFSHSHRIFSSLSPASLRLHPQSDRPSAFADPDEEDSVEESSKFGDEGREEGRAVADPPLPRLPSPKLSIKEKKELASYAHSLGKKLKSQQVGKSGVNPSVAAAFIETLEANELLKLKVHGSCPGELSDVITQLEHATGSVSVGQIGRSVILYRPSLSKLRKKEAQNASNAWTAKYSKSSNTSKMEIKRKMFVRRSR
ncbi:uncharacterized protein LOC122056514 isoform X1 [Zingiber officinale]|uniref:CRM domain-containing protein n=1 Tax=Zingiber officinale TaxID=94328 RepID=A0A8J5H0R1_ZINOF|nr:uncharacterized protein LOC122056514 isoform X1 [Zingiber officinale]KAG6518381.1 hypothetical protein ZIOFF_021856 [Zingiber officinale]